MEEKKAPVFAVGINFERPREGAPDFVKGKVSISVEKFYAWAKPLMNQNGFVNLDLLKSKAKGTLYLTLNDFKPKPKVVDAAQGEVEEPF